MVKRDPTGMEKFVGSRIRNDVRLPLAFGKERLFRSDEGMFTQKIPPPIGVYTYSVLKSSARLIRIHRRHVNPNLLHECQSTLQPHSPHLEPLNST